MIAPTDWLRAVIETARLNAASHVRTAAALAFAAEGDRLRITTASLARRADVSPHVAEKAITRLEHAGFVRREKADYRKIPFAWRSQHHRTPVTLRMKLPVPIAS